MVKREDQFWEKLIRRVSRPPTPEDLDRELDYLHPEPLSEERKESILRRAISEECITPRRRTAPRLDWLDEELVDAARDIQAQVPVLNRNRGDTNPDVEVQLEQLREEALAEDEEEEDDEVLP
jgi:hypothetical protein